MSFYYMQFRDEFTMFDPVSLFYEQNFGSLKWFKFCQTDLIHLVSDFETGSP